MHKFIKWYAPVVTIGVAIFIAFFLFSINSNQEFSYNKQLSLFKDNKELKLEQTWLNSFFNQKNIVTTIQ